jgi:hypothetical protein
VYKYLFISFFDVPSTAAAAAVVFTLQFISAVTLLYIQADPTKKWKLKKYSEHGISKNASFSIKLNLVLVACDGVISDTWRTIYPAQSGLI